MVIRLNGKEEDVEVASNLEELIKRKGLSVERVVVEHNLRIVPMEDLRATGLSENDNIEIVSFVGGG
jgi:sulfur carrier protein